MIKVNGYLAADTPFTIAKLVYGLPANCVMNRRMPKLTRATTHLEN